MDFHAIAGIGLIVLASLAGCVGYVGGPGPDGGAVVVAPVPVFGYWGGHEDWRFGRRGYESRGWRR